MKRHFERAHGHGPDRKNFNYLFIYLIFFNDISQIFQGCGELFHSSKEMKRHFERAHGHGPDEKILFIYLFIYLIFFNDAFDIF